MYTDPAMDLLLGEFTRDQMVAIFYHVNIPSADPFSNSFSLARQTYYSVTGTPCNFIDGEKYSGSYSDITRDAARYRTKINADLGVPSAFTLTMTGRIDTDEGFVIVES